MLKASKIQAVSIDLPSGEQAVLTQDGADWNGLQKFKCISPPELNGAIIIATKVGEPTPFSVALGKIMNIDIEEQWVVVIASQGLYDVLQHEHEVPKFY